MTSNTLTLTSLLFCGVVLLVPLILGIFLIATSRRTGEPGPHCGHCGYNLTGSESNRCPECGKLFIEAGVATAPTARSRSSLSIGIVLVVVSMIPLGFGLIASTVGYARAKRQTIAAQRQAAAVQTFLTSQLAPTSQPTTAPSTP